MAEALVRALAGAPLGDDQTRAVVEAHVISALVGPSNAVLSLGFEITKTLVEIV